jgi:hypothetical protein
MPLPLITAQETGVINFKTDPPGAIIYLDGEEYSVQTPATINNVPVGEHIYFLRKEGFIDFQGKATVTDRTLCCVEVNMSTSKSGEACSTEPVPTYEVPKPPKPKPDYGMLILGLFVGIIIFGLRGKKGG